MTPTTHIHHSHATLATRPTCAGIDGRHQPESPADIGGIRTWRPALGDRPFLSVRYSQIQHIADAQVWTKKTYNNAISALRRAFAFGFKDHPEARDPAAMMRGARIGKKDRPHLDPFSVQDAETLITALRRDWGAAQANYDAFRFFTGLRPSEEIALVVSDYDRANGVLSISKARVDGIQRDRTKTGEDRRVELCPRAITILESHLAWRADLVRAGHIRHDSLFFTHDFQPIPDAKYPFERWHKTLKRLAAALSQAVHRAPYLRELEPHAGEKSIVGRRTARSPNRDDVQRLRGVGPRRA